MRNKKTPNGYSLPQVRAALAPLCEQAKMTTPSLITLKGWSARGVFAKCTSLAQACDTAIKKMSLNATRYEQPSQTPQKSTIAATTRHFQQESKTASKSNLAVVERMDKIEQMLQQLLERSTIAPGRSTTTPGAPSSGMDPTLLSAINQLDGVRKHMMIRIDNEMLLLRQLHGVGTGAQSQRTSPSGDIDLQKILSKLNLLSNINDRLGAVEQLLSTQRLERNQPL